GGSPPSADDIGAIDAPAELQGDKRLLQGWSLFVGGELDKGLDAVLGALQEPPGPSLGLRDLADPLCDPRIDPRRRAQLLMRVVPPPGGPSDQSPVVHTLLLARALARARAGDPGFGGDLQRLEQIDPSIRAPTRDNARAMLAGATGTARLDPPNPG